MGFHVCGADFGIGGGNGGVGIVGLTVNPLATPALLVAPASALGEVLAASLGALLPLAVAIGGGGRGTCFALASVI